MIGDILVKISKGIALTETEQLRLQLWGNRAESEESFISGLMDGSSEIFVNSVRTNRIKVANRVITGVWARAYGVESALHNTTTTLSSLVFTGEPQFGITLSGDSLYVSQTGTYNISLETYWESNATGNRKTTMAVGGITNYVEATFPAVSGAGTSYYIQRTSAQIGSSKAIKLKIHQTSGSTLSGQVFIGIERTGDYYSEPS